MSTGEKHNQNYSNPEKLQRENNAAILVVMEKNRRFGSIASSQWVDYLSQTLVNSCLMEKRDKRLVLPERESRVEDAY